jgi:thiol-disulfide isomerase/thioredoxin
MKYIVKSLFLNIQTVYIIFILFVLSFSINSNAQNGQYLINGTIKGIDSGSVRILSFSATSVFDSAVIRNNKFFMQGKINTPQRLVFNISPGNWSFRAFVENDTIDLFIDTTGAQHYGRGKNKWSLIWEIDEHGSNIADVYAKYAGETEQKYYASLLSLLHQKLMKVREDSSAQERISNKIDSVLHIVRETQKPWIEKYINKNPASIAGVYLFYDYYQSLPENRSSYLDSVLNVFQGQATSSFYYKELHKKALELGKVQIYKPAPGFTLLQRNKSAFTLSSEKGKYILLDFWASWCAPCRKAVPFWKSVYSKYKNKGLSIVSISDDRRRTDWTKALDKEQMPWIQVIDKFPDENDLAIVAQRFGAKRLPFYVLIDKEGMIITCSGDQELIKNKIEELLK